MIDNLNREELLDLLYCYDEYVQGVVDRGDGVPVCVDEYYDNEYQDLLADREQDEENYEMSSWWNDKERRKTLEYELMNGGL